MGNVVVAVPLWHTVPVNWMFNFINSDKTRCVGQVATGSVYLTDAMTMLVDMALSNYGDHDWDRLVIWEHDMIIPVDAINRTACYPDDHDVVGSLYFQHTPPHSAMVYMRANHDNGYWYAPIAPQSVQHMVDHPALYTVDAVGFGFTAISRRLLEQWDRSTPMFHPDAATGLGHDFWFCLKAKEQGFTIAVDSGLICDHLTMLPVGLADHQRHQDSTGEVVMWHDGQIQPFNPLTDVAIK